MRHVDRVVTEAGGAALRYGGFYGTPDDGLLGPVRARRFPVVGDGGGMTSFIHLDDAAAATVLAVEQRVAGIYNIVDDDPAPVREWLPVLADALGAPPPRHVPRWLARLVAGDGAVMMGTEARGASNTKAKRELGWKLRHPTWRSGFAEAYATLGTDRGDATTSPRRATGPARSVTPRPAGRARATLATHGGVPAPNPRFRRSRRRQERGRREPRVLGMPVTRLPFRRGHRERGSRSARPSKERP